MLLNEMSKDNVQDAKRPTLVLDTVDKVARSLSFGKNESIDHSIFDRD